MASSPVTGSLGGYARGTVLRWGRLVHARELCYAGGTPGPRWGTVLRWGDASSTLGNCVTLGGRLVHAEELCYAGGTPGPR